jgi:trehalose/maltose transport system permease protein
MSIAVKQPASKPFLSKQQKHVISRVGFYVLMVIILVYILFPFYWAIRSSVTPDQNLFSLPTGLWPTNMTGAHFSSVFSDSTFLHALLNSTVIAVSVTVLSLVIGSFAAYALGRFSFRGKNPVMYIILSMTMFPQVAILGALYNMIVQFNLYDHLESLVLTYMLFTLPFTVWVLRGFFQGLPRELEEAAYVDGASPFTTFWRIMLPLALPGLVTTGLLAFIGAWNEFLYALTFLLSPDEFTVPVQIFNFVPPTAVGGSFQIPWGSMMAATIVVTVPLVVLTLIFQRKILAGLTAGAVKG